MKAKTFTPCNYLLCRYLLLAGLLAFFGAAQRAHAQYTSYSIINTYAGRGGIPTVGEMGGDVVLGPSGTFYFSLPAQNRVYKTSPPYTSITLVAGTGGTSGSGDGGAATDAELNFPYDLALDAAGNLYIAERYGFRVRRVAPDGTISTIAGTGPTGSHGDGGPATNAGIEMPAGMVLGPNGNLYIAEVLANKVRMVDLGTGLISTVAGTGVLAASGDGGLATQADVGLPVDIDFDAAGNLYIAQVYCQIRKVEAATGIISTVAGNGMLGDSPDGTPALSALLGFMYSISVDGAGSIYFAEAENHVIRKVDGATNLVTTVAGSRISGFWGDGGPATSARIHQPEGLVLDGSGNLIFTQDEYQTIRQVNLGSGIISSVYTPAASVAAPHGDGGDRLAADFHTPRDVAVDAAGNVYIADAGLRRVRKVDAATGIVTTVAGTGEYGYLGDGGPATQAPLSDVAGLALDAAGNIYIADSWDFRIRKVTAATGIITTVAGNGTYGYPTAGDLATSVSIGVATDMVVDAAGNLYIACPDNQSIFRVDAVTGIITVVAGTGTAGFSGDGGAATSAELSGPHGMVIDASGNLIFCDKFNNRIREVNLTTGIIRTIAGTGVPGIANDGELAVTAQLSAPDDIALDPDGNLVIADLVNNRMRLLDRTTNRLHTVAGNGTPGFSGDGGQATLAQLGFPCGMAIDPSGLTYIADQLNHRIRTFTAPVIIEPLPLDFLTFTATKGANAVELAWTTANEVATRSFVVERLEGGATWWKPVGEVAASGNTTAQTNYRFTDRTVQNKTYAYRLKQLDLDGTYSYSKTVRVSFNGFAAVTGSVHPNPFAEQLNIVLNGATGKALTIRLLNLAGQVQVEKHVTAGTTQTFVINNLAVLKPGVYILQVTGENIHFSQRVVRK